jgi:hypothetical protein
VYVIRGPLTLKQIPIVCIPIFKKKLLATPLEVSFFHKNAEVKHNFGSKERKHLF